MKFLTVAKIRERVFWLHFASGSNWTELENEQGSQICLPNVTRRCLAEVKTPLACYSVELGGIIVGNIRDSHPAADLAVRCVLPCD